VISSWYPAERRTVTTHDMEMGLRSVGTIGTGSAITDEDRVKSVDLTKTTELTKSVDTPEAAADQDDTMFILVGEQERPQMRTSLHDMERVPEEDVHMVLVSEPIKF
jgi:hypothetical protein